MNTKKPPLERVVVKKTIEQLRKRGGFWFKVHGSPMQLAGIPDIIGCYRGRFIAFEAKRDATGKPTAIQAYMMEKIRAAGGIATLIYTPEMALARLDRIDEQRRPSSPTSSGATPS
jgi:penicillin-binding protein-related factor A (putative recombinase)